MGIFQRFKERRKRQRETKYAKQFRAGYNIKDTDAETRRKKIEARETRSQSYIRRFKESRRKKSDTLPEYGSKKRRWI